MGTKKQAGTVAQVEFLASVSGLRARNATRGLRQV